MENKLNAYYCFYAAIVHKELKTYDEFLFAENDAAANEQFRTAVRKKIPMEDAKQATTAIRNVTRIVRAMEKSNVPDVHDATQVESGRPL